MTIRNLLTLIALAALVIVPLSACEKDEQEAAKFPRSDEGSFERKFEPMVSFQIDNGISLYVQRDSTYDDVALELFYRAGFVQEPEGAPQVSHIAEHAVVFSPTANYKAGEIVETVGKWGRINAEAVGDFVHFDFIVKEDKFAQLLEMTSEQLKSIRFTEEVRAEQAENAGKEIPRIVSSQRGSLSKYAFIALAHAVLYGETNVPIQQANFDVTVEDLRKFHETYYRPDDMVIVVVGNVAPERAESLVKKYFGDVPRKPEPPRHRATISSDMQVAWDVDATVVYHVYPGDYPDDRTRAALVAFGTYLNRYIARDPQIINIATTTYTTSPTYPVHNFPFFVFGQAGQYRSPSELSDRLAAVTQEAIDTLDERMFERVITGLKGLVNASFLESHKVNYQIENHTVIGQHAVNTGIIHYLRGGLSVEEYTQLLDSITFEEMQQIIQDYLSPEDRYVVTISRR